MAAALDSKLSLVAKESKAKAEAQLKGANAFTTSVKSFDGVDITRLPTEDDNELISNTEPRTAFHVYQQRECHKCISPVTDPSKERRAGPTVKEQKAKRREKKERKNSGLPLVEPDENAFFLHGPYLAFHTPPRVLYAGNSKHAKPAVLIHEGCFWKEYKLQLGPSIAKPGVLDPRGVVAWRHHGGDKDALKRDDKKLKGYKVRTWRLWGETGKDFVHSVRENRKAGTGPDPDVLDDDLSFKPERPATADEVVYLRWTNPLSRHTRRYHFQYAGIDFFWKGTGTVKESRVCGRFLRYNHLKLVAKLPGTADGKNNERSEVCLGKYISSVAKLKNGTLEFFDAAILRLAEDHAPSMLLQNPFEEQPVISDADEAAKVSRMKRSTLYQVIVATGMCMVIGEKEKRHTLIDLIAQAGEGGGGAGG